VVRIVLGLLLLATAGLKIHGLYTDPYSQESILLSPRMIVAVIELEVLLGLWLLSGFAVRAARVAALVFFALGAAGSLYLAIEGQASCGCFGRVEVSPWTAVTLDLLAVAVLFTFKPSLLPIFGRRAEIPYALKIALVSAILLALTSGAFLLLTDDPVHALDQIRGQVVAVDPPRTNVGDAEPGARRAFAVRITNLTNKPIRIVGGTVDCQCLATRELPRLIPANHTVSITVEMRFQGTPGRFVHRCAFHTDAEEQRVVVARFAGRVLGIPDE
jgi:hypothetical protein